MFQDCFLLVHAEEGLWPDADGSACHPHKLARMIGAIESLEGFVESIVFQMANMPHKQMMTELGGPIAIMKYQAVIGETKLSDGD